MPEPSAPSAIPPFIDWMSRRGGLVVLGAILLPEVGFHVWAAATAGRREAAAAGGASAAASVDSSSTRAPRAGAAAPAMPGAGAGARAARD